MVEISTSLLSTNEEEIIKIIYDLEFAKTDYFHIDVMDGKFVQNNTLEKMRKYTQNLKNVSNVPIEVHLMVNNVEEYVKDYIDLEVNSITFQIEACKNEMEVLKQISYIKQNNCKVGIAISPKTNIEKVYEFMPYIHKVIIMTVEPGEGGQQLIPETIQKIQALNKFIYENSYEVDIEVDGGINEKNAKEVTNAGANILVAGSYITNSKDYAKAIKRLKQKM